MEPMPQAESTPEPISCDFGEAGEKCYSVELLDAFAQQPGLPLMTSYTAAGCVDASTATVARGSGCAPFPVGSGERRGSECCYQHCNNSPACGRPLVISGAARVAQPRPSLEWARESGALPSQSNARAGAEIAAEWLRDALAEHASVAAFSTFNLSLLALGAPAALVRASAAAALDEVFHATACFELASHYGGRALGPAPLDIADLQVPTELCAVVERAFIDGCIGETAAALVARASLDKCGSPRVVAVLARIADDETKHAELAWQFVAWALRRGGGAVARVLSSALERATAELASHACRASGAASPEWHQAGRLSDAERTCLMERALREVVRPALAALLERHPSPPEARTGVAPAA